MSTIRRGLSRFSRRARTSAANRLFRRENGTVPLGQTLLLVVLAAGSQVLAADQPEPWKRYPLATAPHMQQAPAIDGTVDRAEWQTAAQLGPLKAEPEGVADDLRRVIYVGYDRQCLYIGLKIDRPEGAGPPRVPDETGHVDNWRLGDAVEICLDPGHTAKRYYNFLLYANGAFGEGIGQPGVDRNWTAEWRQAAKRTPRGWQGEMAIPFAALGVAGPPAPGDVWGFDVMEVRRTPSLAIFHWSYRGPRPRALDTFGHLRFAGPAPAVRFLRAEEVGQGRAGVEFQVVNATESEARVECLVQLLHRKDGAAGGPKSYYDNIESGGEYDRTQVEFEKSTKLEPLIAETLRFYEPLSGRSTPETLAVPAGQCRSVGLVHPAPPGEYLVLYEFHSSQGELLGAGAQPFRIEIPLQLTLQPHWLHAQVVDVTADLRKVSGSGPATAVVSLLDQDRRTRQQKKVSVELPAPSLQTDLSTRELAVGFYSVEVVLADGQGKELARNAQALEKPKPPAWHGNDLGRMDVSRPWTPLVADSQGHVKVWGRTCDFTTVLPKSIVTQDDQLLAAPMQLEVQAAGKALTWSEHSVRPESVTPGKAVFRAAMRSPPLVAEGTLSVEFDGFVWYDLTLSPAAGPAEIDSAMLVAQLDARHATLLSHHKFLDDPLLGAEAAKPAQGGSRRLEESLLPLSPYTWVGDETGGLAMIVEGMQDWRVERPNQVMRITPAAEGRPASMRLAFIDAPTRIERPLRWQFGLQATPIRPRPAENVTHVSQLNGPTQEEEYYRQAAAAGGKVVIFHGGWKGSGKGTEWGGWPCRPRTPEGRQRVKNGVALAHKHGLKACLYTGWGVLADSDEYQHFGHEFIRKPVENSGFGTYRQAAGLEGCYIDYMAYAIADLVREYDADGVMWDSCSNLFTDRNLRIGNGWIDDDGNVRPTFPVRATRELFRRVYNLVHGGLKDDGMVVNFGGGIWAINVYADLFHRGEGTPMHVKTLREAWDPLEVFRADYGGRPFGLPYLAMNKNFKRLPMTVNKHHAVTLLHGYHTKAIKFDPKEQRYDVKSMPHEAIWKARNWLPMDGSTRNHFYYQQQAIRPVRAELLSSAFVSGDGRRALLVVSNLDEAAVPETEVRVDLKALGLAPGRPVELEDALLGTPIEFRAGRVRMAIEGERFRLLKLWQK